MDNEMKNTAEGFNLVFPENADKLKTDADRIKWVKEEYDPSKHALPWLDGSLELSNAVMEKWLPYWLKVAEKYEWDDDDEESAGEDVEE